MTFRQLPERRLCVVEVCCSRVLFRPGPVPGGVSYGLQPGPCPCRLAWGRPGHARRTRRRADRPPPDRSHLRGRRRRTSQRTTPSAAPPPRCCWPAPATPPSAPWNATRSPGVDAVARHVAQRDPAARRCHRARRRRGRRGAGGGGRAPGEGGPQLRQGHGGCEPPSVIRVSRRTLAKRPILCGECMQGFEAE